MCCKVAVFAGTSCIAEERIICSNLLLEKIRLLLVPGRGSSYQYIELSSKMEQQEPRKCHQQVVRAWRMFHVKSVKRRWKEMEKESMC